MADRGIIGDASKDSASRLCGLGEAAAAGSGGGGGMSPLSEGYEGIAERSIREEEEEEGRPKPLWLLLPLLPPLLLTKEAARSGDSTGESPAARERERGRLRGSSKGFMAPPAEEDT